MLLFVVWWIAFLFLFHGYASNLLKFAGFKALDLCMLLWIFCMIKLVSMNFEWFWLEMVLYSLFVWLWVVGSRSCYRVDDQFQLSFLKRWLHLSMVCYNALRRDTFLLQSSVVPRVGFDGLCFMCIVPKYMISLTGLLSSLFYQFCFYFLFYPFMVDLVIARSGICPLNSFVLLLIYYILVGYSCIHTGTGVLRAFLFKI